jgi:hypothetical protein
MEGRPMQVMVLEEDRKHQALLAQALMEKGFHVLCVESLDAAECFVRLDVVDVLIIGERVGGRLSHSLALLAECRNPMVSAIVLTDRVGQDVDELFDLIPAIYAILGRDIAPHVVTQLVLSAISGQVHDTPRSRIARRWSAAEAAEQAVKDAESDDVTDDVAAAMQTVEDKAEPVADPTEEWTAAWAPEWARIGDVLAGIAPNVAALAAEPAMATADAEGAPLVSDHIVRALVESVSDLGQSAAPGLEPEPELAMASDAALAHDGVFSRDGALAHHVNAHRTKLRSDHADIPLAPLGLRNTFRGFAGLGGPVVAPQLGPTSDLPAFSPLALMVSDAPRRRLHLG